MYCYYIARYVTIANSKRKKTQFHDTRGKTGLPSTLYTQEEQKHGNDDDTENSGSGSGS